MDGAKAVVKPTKHRPLVREVRVELCGRLHDANYQLCSATLREFRTRYNPLIRCYFTAVGDAASGTDSQSEDSLLKTHFRSSNVSALSFDGHVALHRLSEERRGVSAPQWLVEFMEQSFLAAALRRTLQQATHPAAALSELTAFKDDANEMLGSSPWPLLFRHFIHEGTRTASFLIADLASRQAVVVDPQFDISEYLHVLRRHSLQLVAVCLTCFFMDIRTGHKELMSAFPNASLITGCNAQQHESVVLSVRFCVRVRSAPLLTSESVLFELYATIPSNECENVRVAVMTGASLPLDGFPRCDLKAILPTAPCAADSNGAADCSDKDAELLASFRALQEVFRVYFGSTFQSVPLLDAAVLFPSHGGYSHMTHQLDLHWAAHVADLKRFSHVKRVYEVLRDDDYKAFCKYVKALPRLPVGGMFALNRAMNMADAGFETPESRQLLLSQPTAHSNLTGDVLNSLTTSSMPSLLVVDVRPYEDYVAAHVPLAVNVPMTFPAAKFGAKKAELWLQCLLTPRQQVVAVCKDDAHRLPTLRRFELVGARCVDVCTDADVQHVTAANQQQAQRAPDSRPPTCYHDGVQEGTTMGVSVPGRLRWFRLTTTECLAEIDVPPNSTTLVVDVRTPYEYKNGSHRNSVHVPLADLCAMCVDTATPRTQLAARLLERLHDDALVAGSSVCRNVMDLRRVVFYCAAGYRSHVAVSLLKAAVEIATQDQACNAALPYLEVADVSGGALQIMMHRPDLWVVKDRSIVCIS